MNFLEFFGKYLWQINHSHHDWIRNGIESVPVIFWCQMVLDIYTIIYTTNKSTEKHRCKCNYPEPKQAITYIKVTISYPSSLHKEEPLCIESKNRFVQLCSSPSPTERYGQCIRSTSPKPERAALHQICVGLLRCLRRHSIRESMLNCPRCAVFTPFKLWWRISIPKPILCWLTPISSLRKKSFLVQCHGWDWVYQEKGGLGIAMDERRQCVLSEISGLACVEGIFFSDSFCVIFWWQDWPSVTSWLAETKGCTPTLPVDCARLNWTIRRCTLSLPPQWSVKIILSAIRCLWVWLEYTAN